MSEAADEVEVLSSIFAEEFQLLSDSPYQFTIDLFPAVDDDQKHVGIKLTCTLPDGYPDVIAKIDASVLKGLGKKQIDEIKALANQTAEENIGMPSIFMVTEAVKEWLMDNNVEGQDGSMYAEMMRRMNLKELEHKKKSEKAAIFAAADREANRVDESIDLQELERQRKRQAGTAVTVDSFLQWKAKFDQEMKAIELAQRGGVAIDTSRDDRPTGKQLFLSNRAGREDTILSASELEEMEKALEGLDELDFEAFEFEDEDGVIEEESYENGEEDGNEEYVDEDEDEDEDDEQFDEEQ